MRISDRPHRRRAVCSARSDDVNKALAALSVEELRAFIIDSLEYLADRPRHEREDAILRTAATGAARWRPACPPSTIVDDVVRFAQAAQRAGLAEPSEVDDYLRQGIKASLAGKHAVARAIFEALLIPIASADIDLGQHEMADEVLSTDLHDCVARHVAAVYVTTALADRAAAVATATEQTHSISSFSDPLTAIEGVLGVPLPDLDAFLPAWIARLESGGKLGLEWESDEERWLREAIERRDGVAGLERIARSTKRPAAVQAWCDAVQATGDWSTTLSACEAGAALVTSEPWRGGFLDVAALAAQELGRKDTIKKLEAAWRGAPSLTRLLRWLLAGEPEAANIRKRAATTLEASPTKAPRLIGFLHVLVGDIEAAGRLLEKAAGLGWSRSDHPGHLLFPVFAWMLGGMPTISIREALAPLLDRPVDERPQFATPTAVNALQRAKVIEHLTAQHREAALAAMKTAAAKRTDGVLAEKRRGHYHHAAALIACCVHLEPKRARAAGTSPWAAALRTRTSRFPAFQQALRGALA